MGKYKISQYRRQLVIVIFVVALLLVGNPLTAEARSYHFPQLEIVAEILEDGSMKVQEKRIADFRGTYSGLYQWIYKQPREQFVDVVISEHGRPYEYNPGSEFGPAGTYLVQDSPESIYIDWSFDATDEVRAFSLEYRILNVVKIHEDVAEIYFRFIGDEWDVRVDQVRVTLTLPEGARDGDIRAWGHGPLNGVVTIDSPRQVVWEIDRLPSRTPLTGRVTFPKDLVPLGTNTTDREALPAILEQEQKWADDANRNRELASVSWILSGLILVLGFIYTVRKWYQYGRAHRSEFQGDYYRELPDQYTPAEMAVLWNFKRVTPADLTATIMDLARRGVLRIDEIETESKGIFKKSKQVDYRLTIKESAIGPAIGPVDELVETSYRNLLTHEKQLLDFLFKKVSKGNSEVTFKEIEKYAEKNKKPFATFWEAWSKQVKKQGEAHNFFDEHSGGKAFKHALPGILLLLLGFILFIWQIASMGPMISLGIAGMITGFIILVGLAIHGRRSVEGQEQYVKWKAFRKFLQHFSNMDKHDIPSLVVWEHYLVYAVSLGIAKEVMKQLQLVYPSMEQDGHRFGYGWYYYNASAANFTGLGNSFESMTNSFTQTVQQSITAATSQSSSGTGGGGGFSGGGGGGFSGGGGGGAR